jgi:hypothetical protein
MTFTIVYPFDVTIPAGTAKAAPVSIPTQFEPNVVERIDWTFPDGCAGMVGIAIGARAVPVIPPTEGQFFIRSGSSGGYDTEGMHTTGDWSVIGYNTGQFPHTIHVNFTVHRLQVDVKPPVLIVESGNIVGTGVS